MALPVTAYKVKQIGYLTDTPTKPWCVRWKFLLMRNPNYVSKAHTASSESFGYPINCDHCLLASIGEVFFNNLINSSILRESWFPIFDAPACLPRSIMAI